MTEQLNCDCDCILECIFKVNLVYVLKRLYLLVLFSPVLYSQFSLVIYLKSRDRGRDVEINVWLPRGKRRWDKLGGWD